MNEATHGKWRLQASRRGDGTPVRVHRTLGSQHECLKAGQLNAEELGRNCYPSCYRRWLDDRRKSHRRCCTFPQWENSGARLHKSCGERIQNRIQCPLLCRTYISSTKKVNSVMLSGFRTTRITAYRSGSRTTPEAAEPH